MGRFVAGLSERRRSAAVRLAWYMGKPKLYDIVHGLASGPVSAAVAAESKRGHGHGEKHLLGKSHDAERKTDDAP